MRGPAFPSLAIVLAIAAGSSGCSLVLDWQLPPDAGLPMEACSKLEPNDTFDQAITLDITDPGPFAICLAGDVDYYRFNVPVDGQNVTISVHHDLERPSTQDLDVFLFDTAGAMLSSSTTFAMSETIVCPGSSPACAALVAGDYVVQVIGATEFVFNTYQLQIMITPP